MQLRSVVVAFLVLSLGVSLNNLTWIVLGISLLVLILSFRSSVPGRRSISCICSKVIFLCWMISFTTDLTKWVDRSSFSFLSVIFFVCVGIVGLGSVWPPVMLWLFLPAKFVLFWDSSFCRSSWRHLVSVVTWIFAVVAIWLGFLCVLLCGFMRHSIYLLLIWSFQTIQFQLLFKMWHNLFICAMRQMRLVNWFLSGLQALWCIGIVRWSPERQLWMHVSLVSGVRLENPLNSGSLGWSPVVENCVLL